MAFELDERQRALKKEAAAFAKREIEPVVGELDAAEEHPTAVLEALGEAGFGGLTVPGSTGGAVLISSG